MLRKPEISVGLMYHWPGLKRMLSVLQRAQSQFNSVIDLILIDLMENKIELPIYCLSLKITYPKHEYNPKIFILD